MNPEHRAKADWVDDITFYYYCPVCDRAWPCEVEEERIARAIEGRVGEPSGSTIPERELTA